MEKISYPKEIQLFFNEIVKEVKNVLNPDYILIAGSFGKESWLYYNEELISDFEFVFVCKNKWSLKKKSQLLKKLNIQFPYEISLKGFLLDKIQNRIISNYALKNTGYLSLDFFDAFSNPVVIYSRNESFLDINYRPDEIPVWEAWRLYVNRMGDLLKLESNKGYDKKTEDYFWLKIFESTAGAYFIINKLYNKNISKRIEIFDNELIECDEGLDEICKDSLPIIRKALVARQKHDLSFFDIKIDITERKDIVSSWMNYIEKKLIDVELISSNDNHTFYEKYLDKVNIQQKYLGFSYRYNQFVSNIIRLAYHPKLLNSNFKFYNHRVSWRHIILLCISSTFNEERLNIEEFIESKKIASQIVRKKAINNLDREKFIEETLIYWKILR